MRKIYARNFLLLPPSLILLFIVSFGPAVLMETATPTATPALSATFEISATPVCDFPCPADSFTLTAAMGLTFVAIPSRTPPPWATVIPSEGDLGWGAVYGSIVDGFSGLPLEGATLTCEHSSTVSLYLCNGVTTTNSEGMYYFTDVYFHESDQITLTVEARGYVPLIFDVGEALIPPADFLTDLGLFPLADGTATATPIPVMCTAPACSDGILVCGVPDGCPLGCGTICLPTTSTP